MKTEQRLQELGIELAPAIGPLANYVNAVRTGNLLYLAGKGPGVAGQPRQGQLQQIISSAGNTAWRSTVRFGGPSCFLGERRRAPRSQLQDE